LANNISDSISAVTGLQNFFTVLAITGTGSMQEFRAPLLQA
jgi:hypothetical protein